MEHDGNRLHLDRRRDPEAGGVDVLQDLRVDFVFLLKLIKCGNRVRKVRSLDTDLVPISEAVYLTGKRQTLSFCF